ncbi:MAG: glycosyltransferase family 4 protein [Candidatus Delongbacteria bacterium]|nr:glycosyltransferase family 4 protein [Candidatus Delongbacteria bacterium]
MTEDKKNIVFAVYDHLHTEYRGFKTATSFIKFGHKVKIIGIKHNKEKQLYGWDNIKVKRLTVYKCLPLFLNMVIFWIKLFCKLLVTKADVLYSHDIFPLLPVYLVAKLKKIPFVYDAHEFWHGNSHVENRPFMKWLWTTYEKLFIQRADKVITVSDPIADELKEIYKLKEVKVFSNLPLSKDLPSDTEFLHRKLEIDKSKKIVLYQGHLLFNNGLDDVTRAFVNIDKNTVLVLLGEGEEKESLRKLSTKLGLTDRIFFLDEVPHDQLIKFTVCADIGLCLIKNSGESFYYSTPNKMFEYLQSEVPQLASNFPEITKVVEGNNVGKVIDPSNIEMISNSLNTMLKDENMLKKMKDNCKKVKDNYSWNGIEEGLVEYMLNS